MNQYLSFPPSSVAMQGAASMAPCTLAPTASLRPLALAALAATTLLLGACTSTRLASPAPVEDRGAQRGAAPAVSAGAVNTTSVVGNPIPDPTKPPPPGIENAGKPGYYTVRPGDRLIRISLEAGQNWRDLVRWNNLENPDRIEVGQVLRIVPPTAGTTVASAPVVVPVPATSSTTASAQAPAAATTGVTTSSVSGSSVTAQPLPTAPATPAATPAPAPASKPSPAPQPARGGDDAVNFIWPASGSVVASFDEQKNKGVGIAGKAGDPVLAAAEGRVVYAGSGLRGYGNLIILKHNNTFLTAYAHNQSLLVKEDQDVKQGQKIAEMGSSDADRVKLHFEVRRNGKPVDPAKFLPSR